MKVVRGRTTIEGASTEETVKKVEQQLVDTEEILGSVPKIRKELTKLNSVVRAKQNGKAT